MYVFYGLVEYIVYVFRNNVMWFVFDGGVIDDDSVVYFI